MRFAGLKSTPIEPGGRRAISAARSAPLSVPVSAASSAPTLWPCRPMSLSAWTSVLVAAASLSGGHAADVVDDDIRSQVVGQLAAPAWWRRSGLPGRRRRCSRGACETSTALTRKFRSSSIFRTCRTPVCDKSSGRSSLRASISTASAPSSRAVSKAFLNGSRRLASSTPTWICSTR